MDNSLAQFHVTKLKVVGRVSCLIVSRAKTIHLYECDHRLEITHYENAIQLAQL